MAFTWPLFGCCCDGRLPSRLWFQGCIFSVSLLQNSGFETRILFKIRHHGIHLSTLWVLLWWPPDKRTLVLGQRFALHRFCRNVVLRQGFSSKVDIVAFTWLSFCDGLVAARQAHFGFRIAVFCLSLLQKFCLEPRIVSKVGVRDRP